MGQERFGPPLKRVRRSRRARSSLRCRLVVAFVSNRSPKRRDFMGEPLASPLASPRRRKGDRCNGGNQSVRPSALGRDFDAGVASISAGSQKEVRMSNTHDEQIAKWNQQRGPRVGDWCETKDCGLHRIGGARGGRIRLASPSRRLSLESEAVTY